MWPKRQLEKVRIAAILQHHAIDVCPLPGIVDPRWKPSPCSFLPASDERITSD